jgi:hypothetical protein
MDCWTEHPSFSATPHHYHPHGHHRIAHPADFAFVGKTGALADYWPAMIRHVLGQHQRVLVAPAAQIALVAWDDIYS